MKEELIKELVSNNKMIKRMNVQYQHKIETSEKEINQYRIEIEELNNRLQALNRDSIARNGL
jgi:SMC interacting uncharacterized protein involved in chromosome segregation